MVMGRVRNKMGVEEGEVVSDEIKGEKVGGRTIGKRSGKEREEGGRNVKMVVDEW
jgi:hypothetical protein